MIQKTFDEITAGDIRQLIEDQVPESQTLEYKEALPGKSESDKKEFLADLSALANSSGGYLVYGVREARDKNGQPTGVPEAIVGLGSLNQDQEWRRLENVIRTCVEPQISIIGHQFLEIDETKKVLLISVGKSWTGPHMVRFGKSQRFYTRRSTTKYPMDWQEIRDSFLEAESVPERIFAFKRRRLEFITASDTPVPLPAGPKLVIHLVPYSALATRQRVDPSRIPDLRNTFLGQQAADWTGRYNIDGYLLVAPGLQAEEIDAYLQVFRTGAVEFVERRVLIVAPPDRPALTKLFDVTILDHTRWSVEGLRALGLEGPFAAFVSLLDVEGLLALEGYLPRSQHTVDRPLVEVPEVVIDSGEANLAAALKPAIDAVWQAAGMARSPSYDTEGNWIA